MWRLTWPLVLAELGWMGMSVVDTMMVGRVPHSAEAIGAVSLGGIVFYTVAIFGSGLMLGLDTLISHAYGAGRVDDCHRSLITATYLALPLAPLLMAAVWFSVPLLEGFGVHPAVIRNVVPYLKALNWSTFPLLLYFAFRRYLQGMGLVKPVTFALISANVINFVGNWVLVYGHLGFPALGVEGSGWSTCLARVWMSAVLLAAILYYDRKRQTRLFRSSWAPDLSRAARLLALGFPAAMQITIELAVFALATALIGRLGPVALAGHQIALNAASLTFNVTLGLGAAAGVRVGQSLGRRDVQAAARAGWTGIFLGACFMSCAAVVFVLAPHLIARCYTNDPAVIRAAIALLRVAALFQLFDGTQAIAIGALRGAGDTRMPMLLHGLFYWLLGLPLGYFLCFRAGWGAFGLWAGLCAGLICIGASLAYVWHRRVHAFRLAHAAFLAESV